MQGRIRWVVLALVLALAAPMLGIAAPANPCPDFRYVRGAGFVCDRGNGLLEVFTADKVSVGFSHGPDRVGGASAPSTPAAAQQVACTTGPSGDYYSLVIYARASDDADEYASKVGSIRSIVEQANGMVAEAAAATGDVADLKVHCTSGAITVRNAVLATPRAAADFSTIVTDLRAGGYNDPKVHYWVYYDDTSACTCAGMAHFWGDDSNSVNNASNGNTASPLFAITFGRMSATTMLHELGHNMGAVQDSAGRSTGAGHCTDGYDVMCYNDGGPKGSSYTTSACSTTVWDCGKNDYFHTRPVTGSYLATHWNLGSRLNRYLVFDASDTPVMGLLSCPSKAGVGKAYSCSFRAADASSGLYYTVTWGDGTSSRVPSSGYVAPNTIVSGSHVYASAGTYGISVTATDNGSPARTSPALTRSVQAIVDNTAPSMTVQAPVPTTWYRGCSTQLPWGATGRPAFNGKSCVIVTATDTGTGVAGVTVRHNGVAKGTWTKAPYRIEFVVTGPASNVPVVIEVRDFAGNLTSQTVFVDVIA